MVERAFINVSTSTQLNITIFMNYQDTDISPLKRQLRDKSDYFLITGLTGLQLMWMAADSLSLHSGYLTELNHVILCLFPE